MAEPTPTTPEVLSSTADVKNVKVDVVETVPIKESMPTIAKLAHVLAILVAGVIALCVSSVLSDGNSVIVLKDVAHLPRITKYELKASHGLDYRADELLGPTYGVGLHHDQSGYSWTEIGAGETLQTLIDQLGLPAVVAAVPSVISTDGLKHPVAFLECNELQAAGLSALGLGLIAEIVAVLMILFHSLALAGVLPDMITKVIGGLVWFVLSAGFCIVCMLAVAIYTTTWTCHNEVIPEIKLQDHFNYNYGFAFAITGYLAALLVLAVLLVFTSTSYAAPQGGIVKGLAKVLCGVAGGLTTAVVISMIILAPNDAFATEETNSTINPCAGQKPYHAGPGDHYFSNTECFKDSVTQTLEQAGANVTRGYVGLMDAANRVPISTEYSEAGLCPVNVHWHLGAEHLSVGQFDEDGTGPDYNSTDDHHRQLAADARLGFRCHHYDSHDPKFTTEYDWKHCTNMHVGETYEVHWPHSAAGACGTDWQMQTPFYDGVFCHDGIIKIAPLNTYEKIGVQSQVFTIVNDEEYYHHNLLAGAIVESGMWSDVAKYTGSTTGTSRDNEMCSRYTPITWQVDRTCHMISASSFDQLCQDMLAQKDDMSGDVYPHGARELVADGLAANNQWYDLQTRKK